MDGFIFLMTFLLHVQQIKIELRLICLPVFVPVVICYLKSEKKLNLAKVQKLRELNPWQIKKTSCKNRNTMQVAEMSITSKSEEHIIIIIAVPVCDEKLPHVNPTESDNM